MGKVELNYSFKGADCVKLSHGRYFCVVAPTMGASVLRLRDEENKIDVFRYVESVTADEINGAREIWGLPTLYLPNRFDGGVLKTSDAEYHLPLNEAALGNTIHGWVHKRAHKIETVIEDNHKAVLVTSFTHDKNDEWYQYFPVDFKISYKFHFVKDSVSISNIEKSQSFISS